MHGAVLLDERNQVLRPALIWCDQRTQAQCDADNTEYAERDAKNLEWMRDTFALASQRGARGTRPAM